ncbi:Aspartate aminotransferase [Verticillium dahliae VDG2]|nr:Aspartate aminotransferase [Verticillium dahliae VDG2]
MVEITAQFKRARGFSPKVLLVTPTRAEAFGEQEFLRFQAKLVTNAIFGRDKMTYTPPDPKRSRAAERLFAIIVDSLLPHLTYSSVKMLASVSRSMQATFLGRVRVWNLNDPDTMGFCDWDPELLDVMFDDGIQPEILAPGAYLTISGRGPWSTCDVLYYPDEYDPAWTASQIEDTWPQGQGRRMALEAVKLANMGFWDNQSLDQVPRDVDFVSVRDSWQSAMEKIQSASEGNRRGQRRYFAQLSHLSGMIRGLAQHGSHVRHLELSQIPYLDLKLTGVIIEMLPQLEVLTINACDLMHLGCLVPLLDYINWVACRRDAEYIQLDFFPKAWFGPAQGRECTRILTWGPTALNTRKAVMCTIITAAMKSSEMGHDLLAGDSLLFKYLALVPMDFGLIHVFIRNVKAYIYELQHKKKFRTETDDARIMNLEHQILAALTTGDHRQIQTDMVMALMLQKWTCSKSAAEYKAPLKAQMIAPMLKNGFVAGPSNSTVHTRSESWMATLGSEKLRTLHEDKSAWSYAGYLARTLDAKNIFAEALGMHLDGDYVSNRATGGQLAGPKQPVQPFREHIDRQSWESLYAYNIQTEKVKQEAKAREFW